MKKVLPIFVFVGFLVVVLVFGRLILRASFEPESTSEQVGEPTWNYIDFGNGTDDPNPEPLDADKLWNLIQVWRQSDDCGPGGCELYIKDERLCEIAEDRVKDGSDDHQGLYEKYKDYPYAIVENSTGAISEDEALQEWLSSTPHARTLREPYKYSCVAVSNDYFAVQIFSDL